MSYIKNLSDKDTKSNMVKSSLNTKGRNDEIDFSKLFKSFIRRKDLIITIFSALFFLNLFYVSYRRIFKPIYTGKFSILIQKPKITSNESGGNSFQENIFQQIIQNESSSTLDKPTLFEFLKSDLVLNKISQKYNIENKKLANMISINEGKNSSKQRTKGIIDVKLNILNKELGKQILKDLSQTYLDFSLAQKRDSLTKSLKVANERYKLFLKDFSDENSKLANFRITNNMFDPNAEAIEIKEKENIIKNKINQLNTSDQILDSLLKDTQLGKITIKSFIESISSSNTGLLELESLEIEDSQAFSIEKELANARSKFRPESSTIKSLEKKLAAVKPQIIDRKIELIKRAKLFNKNEKAAYQETSQKLLEKFRELPTLIQSYDALIYKIKYIEKNITNLSLGIETLKAELENKTYPWELLQVPFLPENPTKPKFLFEIFRGSLIGFVISIITGLSIDRFRESYYSANDLESNGYRVLTDLPFEEELDIFNKSDVEFDSFNKLLEEQKNKFSKFEDSVINLINKLKLFREDNNSRIFSFLKIDEKERNYLLHLYLFRLLSDIGLKILLIDLNYKDPLFDEIFKLSNNNELAEYFSDEKKDYKKLIKNISNFRNIKCITCGKQFNSIFQTKYGESLSNLIFKIKESKEYDFIFINTFPIRNSMEIIPLNKLLDGSIVQITLGKTSKKVIDNSLFNLEKNGSKLIGLVSQN